MSLPGAITSVADNRVSVIATVVDTLGKHLAKHKVARGQDFWQSGIDCLWSEGHGMPSGMDAIPSIVVATGSTTIMAAADGVTIGAVTRLTTARIASRQRKKGQNFTWALWHMLQCKKSSPSSHVCVRGQSPPEQRFDSNINARDDNLVTIGGANARHCIIRRRVGGYALDGGAIDFLHCHLSRCHIGPTQCPEQQCLARTWP